MSYHESILEIYKVEHEKYEKTRGIQWKMNISVWTIIAATIYAQSNNTLHILKDLKPNQIFVAYVVLVAVHLFFLCKIQSSLNRSLERMNKMVIHVTENKGENFNWKKAIDGIPWLEGWDWVALQGCITFMLVFILINLKTV